MSTSDVPRSVLLVIYALAKVGGRGATYQGLQELLGFNSDDSVRVAVRRARSFGCVEVISTGRGQRAKSIVRLTEQAQEILSNLELPTDVQRLRS